MGDIREYFKESILLAFKGSRQVRWTEFVWLKYSQRRLGLQSGLQGGHHQVELHGGHQGVLHVLESFQMDSGKVNIGQEWSGVVSAEGSTWHFKVYFTPHNSKVKSHLNFIWAWHNRKSSLFILIHVLLKMISLLFYNPHTFIICGSMLRISDVWVAGDSNSFL